MALWTFFLSPCLGGIARNGRVWHDISDSFGSNFRITLCTMMGIRCWGVRYQLFFFFSIQGWEIDRSMALLSIRSTYLFTKEVDRIVSREKNVVSVLSLYVKKMSWSIQP